MDIKFKSKVKKLEHLAGHYLDVSAANVTKAGGAGKQRFQCTVNGSLTWACGIVAHKNGGGYILINKKQMTSLGVKEGSSVDVVLKKDKSQHGMEVPSELKEIFKQDREAKKRFDALAGGKRRYIIYYINKVKSPDLRIERAVRLIRNLKSLPKGKENFMSILA